MLTNSSFDIGGIERPNPETVLMGRSSGVLLHISSLPSEHGIGDMGEAAYSFAKNLRLSGQKYWQILPLNPSNPHAGESPYFSSSAFAGNPLLIDLRQLVVAGFIQQNDIRVPRGLPVDSIDFGRVREFKVNVLYQAAKFFLQGQVGEDYIDFCNDHDFWLDDFSLFTALQSRYKQVSWSDWPEALRDRRADALSVAASELENEIEREKVVQYFFYQQWNKLKNYCNSLGLVIFGDMPIYVNYESADVWVNHNFFKLDGKRKPTAVSGVPPDYFSATGQLWNNPVYDWGALHKDNFQWWVKRMEALFKCFDVVRIDHFRGLVQYWEVPAGECTAINGSWQRVPTEGLFSALLDALPHFPVVVEDLGIITDDVVAIKDAHKFPGMLILQFAFEEGNSDEKNPYLPRNHIENALAYLGSHDNTTAKDWFDTASPEVQKNILANVPVAESVGSHISDQLIALLMSSKANIAIVTVQDLLGLPGSARMNNPASNDGNWRWRLSAQQFEALPFGYLGELSKRFRRDHCYPAAK